jgi:hypothetical protein
MGADARARTPYSATPGSASLAIACIGSTGHHRSGACVGERRRPAHCVSSARPPSPLARAHTAAAARGPSGRVCASTARTQSSNTGSSAWSPRACDDARHVRHWPIHCAHLEHFLISSAVSEHLNRRARKPGRNNIHHTGTNPASPSENTQKGKNTQANSNETPRKQTQARTIKSTNNKHACKPIRTLTHKPATHPPLRARTHGDAAATRVTRSGATPTSTTETPVAEDRMTLSTRATHPAV